MKFVTMGIGAFGAMAGVMMLASAAVAAPAGAGAAGLAQGADPLVTQVAQGCGRGWHRGPGGRCYRNAPPPRYRAPPPRYRAAPPRGPRCVITNTPRGPVRVCR